MLLLGLVPLLLFEEDPPDPFVTFPFDPDPFDPPAFSWPFPLLLPELFPLPLAVLPFPEVFPFDPGCCVEFPLLEFIWDPCPCVWLPEVVLVFPPLLLLLLGKLLLPLDPPLFFPSFLSFLEPELSPPFSLLLTEFPNPSDIPLLILLIDCAMLAMDVAFITVERSIS